MVPRGRKAKRRERDVGVVGRRDWCILRLPRGAGPVSRIAARASNGSGGTMNEWNSDDGRVRLIRGDALDVLPTLGQVELIATDPPYGKVRGDFDHEWTNRRGMLKDCEKWRDAMFEALQPNGTMYWFAWPSLAGRIEALISERLNPLAHIVWLKPSSHAQKHCPEFLRAPGPETERILMFEHYGADNIAKGEAGYVAKCDELRGFVFEPLRAYLAGEMESAGHSLSSVNKAWQAWKGGNGGMSSHWFTTSQWALPTAENYAWLQGLFNGYLRKEYEDLRKEYEDLRKEYEDLRRYFDMETGDQKTDVWRFPSAPDSERTGHPTQKPVCIMQYIVKLSCRPDGLTVDPFMGSATTAIACINLGRRFIGIERDEAHYATALERVKRELAQGRLAL
jgi:adenine-specific DNA-methyltransferase